MRRGNSGGGGRRNGSPRSQNFDSNGPDIKVRGNAQQVVDKYQALAREAATAGDPVMAENYYQHAEHYYRLMTANGGGDQRRPSDGDRDNGGPANTPSGNGSATATADGGDGNARDEGEVSARNGGAEPTAPSSVEETGEPIS